MTGRSLPGFHEFDGVSGRGMWEYGAGGSRVQVCFSTASDTLLTPIVASTVCFFLALAGSRMNDGTTRKIAPNKAIAVLDQSGACFFTKKKCKVFVKCGV